MDVAVSGADRFAPYKVQGWQDLPDHVKDAAGAWYAAYGGYMSIGYDPRKVPAAGLLRRPAPSPATGSRCDGDPLRSAAAFKGVMAASLRSGRAAAAARAWSCSRRLKKAGQLDRPGPGQHDRQLGPPERRPQRPTTPARGR